MLTFFTIIFLIIIFLVIADFVIKKSCNKNNIVEFERGEINLNEALKLLYHISKKNSNKSRIIVEQIYLALDKYGDDYGIITKFCRENRLYTGFPSYICSEKINISKYVYDYDLENITNEDAKNTVLAMLSLNSSGYYREKTLKYMEQNLSVKFIPFLIVRINDWVPEIRILATKVFLKILDDCPVEIILKNFSSFNSIEKYARFNTNDIMEKIYSRIVTDGNDHVYIGELYKLKNSERFAMIKILGNYKLISKELADYIIENETSPIILELLFSKLAKYNWIYDNEKSVKLLYSNKYFKIKSIILNQLVVMNVPNIEQLLITHLSIKNKSVRATARYNLINIFNVNIRDIYLDNIKNNIDLRYSLIGLSECLNKDDYEIILPYSYDDDFVIASGSLMAMDNLNKNLKFNDLKQYLLSENFSVSNIATSILLRNIYQASSLECKFFESQVANSNVYIRRNVKKLLLKKSYWCTIYYIVKFYDDQDEIIQNICIFELKKWLNQTNRYYHTNPTESQILAIQKIIEEKEAIIGEKIAKEILFRFRKAFNL